MIDPEPLLCRSSPSEGLCVDACQATQNLRGPGKASAVNESDIIGSQMTRRCIPADVAYIEALGRAFHHFTYLEWIAVSIMAQLCHAACVRPSKGKSAGYLARKLHEALDAASPPLAPNLRQRLSEFHKSFVAAKHRRNRLISAHPYIDPEGLQQFGSGSHQWPLHKLEAAAKQFEQAAIEGSDIFSECIRSERIGNSFVWLDTIPHEINIEK
jgi:hypothetical protein